MQKLGNPIYRTSFDSAIDSILKLSTSERYEPDLQQLDTPPSPEGPAVHCRHAIRSLTEIARSFYTDFINRKDIAYAALAANDAIEELRYLADYVPVDDDIINIRADADLITAATRYRTPMPPGSGAEGRTQEAVELPT